MWVIRCNGRVMGRMKELGDGVDHMRSMMETLGKVSDKWSLSQE